MPSPKPLFLLFCSRFRDDGLSLHLRRLAVDELEKRYHCLMQIGTQLNWWAFKGLTATGLYSYSARKEYIQLVWEGRTLCNWVRVPRRLLSIICCIYATSSVLLHYSFKLVQKVTVLRHIQCLQNCFLLLLYVLEEEKQCSLRKVL